MFTPVTAKSQPGRNFPREFTLGQGRAARYEAAPATGQVSNTGAFPQTTRLPTPVSAPTYRVAHAAVTADVPTHEAGATIAARLPHRRGRGLSSAEEILGGKEQQGRHVHSMSTRRPKPRGPPGRAPEASPAAAAPPTPAHLKPGGLRRPQFRGPAVQAPGAAREPPLKSRAPRSGLSRASLAARGGARSRRRAPGAAEGPHHPAGRGPATGDRRPATTPGRAGIASRTQATTRTCIPPTSGPRPKPKLHALPAGSDGYHRGGS